MADTKISGLAALGAKPAPGDLLPIVDVSDTSMAGTGTDKYVTYAYLRGPRIYYNENFTGWTTGDTKLATTISGAGSSITSYSGGLIMVPGTTSGGTAMIKDSAVYPVLSSSAPWNYNPTFSWALRFDAPQIFGTNLDVRLFAGESGALTGTTHNSPAVGWRFDCSASALYAFASTGSANTESSNLYSSFSGNNDGSNILAIEMTSVTSAKYYLNGALLATITTNLPGSGGEYWQGALGVSMINNAAVTARTMYFTNFGMSFDMY